MPRYFPIPQEVSGERVIAFAPVISLSMNSASVPSGALARVVTEQYDGLYAVYSVANLESGLKVDGRQAGLTYRNAVREMSNPQISETEFANTI